MKHLLSIAILSLVTASVASAITAEEIIEQVEKNQVHKTAVSEGLMIITDRFGSRTKTFKSFAAGTDQMLIEFTNPEEQGQKILRLEDEIYLYFPDAEEIIHLQGSALKESIMGSDFSYEDMTGEKGLLDLYYVKFIGTVLLEGRNHYHLELEGKKRGVAYPRQEVWVDAELMVVRKANYFSLSGRLIKEMETGDIRRIAGKNIPHYFVMRDKMKKNSSTEFELKSLSLGKPLPAKIFSLEELSW